ncbi:MAG: hypothetical protein ACTSWC_10735, partial [Promethearchaeota archaeon]
MVCVHIPVTDFEVALRFYDNILASPVEGLRIGLDLKEKVEIRSNSAVICFNVRDIDKTTKFLSDLKVETSMSNMRKLPRGLHLYENPIIKVFYYLIKIKRKHFILNSN